MNEFTRRVWKRVYAAEVRNRRFDDGLNNMGRPGHTREGSSVAEAHDGPTTAHFYMGGTALGQLEESKGKEMLEAIRSLQIRDKNSPYYGGFFWYREERNMHDTNAAFFILSPLVVLRLLLEECIPSSHKPILDDMLERASRWFTGEIKHPKLYYPNKILSDGALLLGIAHLTRKEELYRQGVAFFEQWLDYTERRGWGWGENMSLSYIQICVNALQIARHALKAEESELSSKLYGIIQELMQQAQFHSGTEFVPAIRSYNFEGREKPESLLWWLSGVNSDRDALHTAVTSMSGAMALLLSEELLDQAEQAVVPVPRQRTVRVFDGSHAYSWIGHTVRLGTISRFPVIPGSYQWPTWGLGWQSFPASFAVQGEQVAYLRWYVHDGEKARTHPSYDKRFYLSPALFKESLYPNVQMRAAQAENTAIIVRSMSGVNNEASEIADEWVIHRFKGEVSATEDAAGRKWIVLHYPHALVAITSLKGITAERHSHGDMEISIVRDPVEGEADTLRLRQPLSQGSLRQVCHPRLESAWAVCVLDHAQEKREADKWLQASRIVEERIWDCEVPREIDFLEKRKIRWLHGLHERVSLEIDPHEIR